MLSQATLYFLGAEREWRTFTGQPVDAERQARMLREGGWVRVAGWDPWVVYRSRSHSCEDVVLVYRFEPVSLVKRPSWAKVWAESRCS